MHFFAVLTYVMCGIAGLVSRNGTIPDQGMVQRVSNNLTHRGPDGTGTWVAPGVGLGHMRLAIIDLTPDGAQPMHSADGRFIIVYNGEIYNYKKLKTVCESRGSRFRSESDTEVILEAFRYYGTDVVKHLRGMFAFAIWDRDEERLFIARDRMGKKPFFWRRLTDGTIAFASEVMAIRNLEPVTIDEAAVRLFFGLQYVPSPRTGFKEIFSVPAGHRGWIHRGEVTIETYHDPNDVSISTSGNQDADLVSILEEACRVRLQADVPVGAFLSGGIDSAAIVALTSRSVRYPLRTFTMGFPESGFDERREAQMIADYFGTEHMEFVSEPGDLSALAEQVVSQYGVPYADSSAIPVMLLSKKVAKQIKVVLVGDGGDELFGGYRRYRAYLQALNLAKIPATESAIRVACRVSDDIRYERMLRTMEGVRRSPAHGYAELFTGAYFDSTGIRQLLNPDFLHASQSFDAADYIVQHMMQSGDPLADAMRFDLESYLPDDLNVKMDRATMAFGLEARAPFLDQNMVKFALGLPLKEKVNYGKTKVALKRAMKGILPPEVLRRKKQGFQVPLADWFRGPLGEYWRERVLGRERLLSQYVQPDAAQTIFNENAKGSDHGNRLWMLLSLSLWLESTKSHE